LAWDTGASADHSPGIPETGLVTCGEPVLAIRFVLSATAGASRLGCRPGAICDQYRPVWWASGV